MEFDDITKSKKSAQPDPWGVYETKIPESVGFQPTGVQQPPTRIVVAQDMGLSIKVDHVVKRLNELESRMHLLQSAQIEPSEEIIELREVSFEEAKREIATYFEDHHGENIDAADLQEALGIEIELVIQICEELEEEGKIKAS